MSEHSSKVPHELRAGAIVDGPELPEPIRLAVVDEVGSSLKLVGEGLRTGRFQQLILSPNQVSQLRVAPAEGTFDGDPMRFRLGIEAQRLALAYEYDPYFSLSISRVDPLPHQVEAVYDAMLPLPRIRFLLADDAGAGKTIMAGLLLRELKLRGLVERTLIVTPANLAFQWQRELHDRFRERFEILRGLDLRNAYGTNPWQEKPQLITSIDWAKRDEVRESLAHSHWDLAIVDEAHRMSASDAEHKTERYRLGELLSEHADHLVLLTATPHKGDPENFALFLRLLDRDAYAHVTSLELAMRRNHAPFYLRRVKEALVSFPDPDTGEVHKLFTKRETRTAAFDLDPDELRLYEAVTRYVFDQSLLAASDESARGRAIGFTMALYQRRLASSVHALRRSLERRVERIDRKLRAPGGRPATSAFDPRRLDELDELDEAEAERLSDEAEEASLAEDRAALSAERAQLPPLIEQARRLEAREASSKLAKLREVLSDQRVFADPTTKLLIFTEHKDTLDFLVERLRAWGLSVTQIHGGMPVGDRDAPGTRLGAEREFRDEAQVMVATEAAGEGINLQFCWLMVNYDIPWNPTRLEQRIGRIHRYGQEKDCLIFNFVARNTREGQVLRTLLDRLDEIRRALGSDQVFDVVGEVVPANFVERLLRDHYAGRISRDQMLERIVTEVDRDHFERITRSALEGLARRELNLSRLVAKRAEAKERRLVPEVVEQFFFDAAPLLGLRPVRERRFVARLGRISRNLITTAQSSEARFGRIGREYRRIAFDRAALEHDPTLEWVTPGHPLFEAVREEAWTRAQEDLRRGTLFYDLQRERPARLDVFAASVRDGTGQTLHRRLFIVESDFDDASRATAGSEPGALHLRQPTVFLDLIPAPDASTPNDQGPTRAEVEAYLLREALVPLQREVAAARAKELETIAAHVELALNALINRAQLQLAGLIARQQAGDDVALPVQDSERRLDELNERLEQRRALLRRQGALTLADLTHLGSAWALPHPGRAAGYREMVSDPEIERIAVDVAMQYERDQGRQPESVEQENRGFDVLSMDPQTGLVRFIEVKGRAGTDLIALSSHEYGTAQRLGADYWLYAVFDCAHQPTLRTVRDPGRLPWEAVTQVQHYRVGPETLTQAATSEEGSGGDGR
ncbi:MAG: helicase-related protein [Candidatus Limnocylindrales bacterium]